MELNNFFNDPDYARSWCRSVQDVDLPPLPEPPAGSSRMDSTAHAH